MKMTTSREILCAVALLAASCAHAGRSYYQYEMAENETFELALDNVTNTFYNANGAARGHIFVAESGCTVKFLPGAAPGGVATIYASFLASKGDLTLDLSALSDYSEVWFRGSVRSDGNMSDTIGETTGRVRVVGRDRLLVGTSKRGSDTDINYPFLHTDFVFDSPTATGLVLTNDVSLMSLPSSCDMAVSDGARIGLVGNNLLGLGVSDTLTLTNHDVYLLRKTSVPTNTTVAVPAGRALYYRPVGIQNYYEWGGNGNNTFDFNVSLQDSSARFKLINNSQDNYIRGTVSGTGGIEMLGTGSAYFLGDVAIDGAITWYTTGKLHFRGTAGGPNAVFAMDVAKSGVFFEPGANDALPGVAEVAALSGVATNCLVHVCRRRPLNIASASGKFGIVSDDGGKVVIGSLAAGAEVALSARVELQINAMGEGAKVYLVSAGARKDWSVTGPASGERVSLQLVPLVEGGTLEVGGRLDLGALDGFEAVNVAEDADVAFTPAAGTRIGGRGANISLGGATSDSWKSKVALWVDASAPESFEYVKDVWSNLSPAPVVTTGGVTYDQILGWKDVRPERRTYQFRNNRFSNATAWNNTGGAAANVCPYVVPNGIGTNCYVSMSGNSRYLRITSYNTMTKKNLATEYAIVVFGSQSGGGVAMLASTNAVFGRATAGNQAAQATQYAITTNSFDAYVDGVATNTSEATFNGGWQIVSLDTKGNAVSGIGYAIETSGNLSGTRGYTQYAEILLFSEAPTAEERRAVEEYLAAKWNIQLGGEPVSRRLVLSGSGELALAQDVEASGLFTGTVNLNGHKLSLPEGRFPFTEGELPSEGRSIWADPSLAGAVNLSSDPEKPLEMERLYMRNEEGVRNLDGALVFIPPINGDGKTDRRPVISSGARAAGSASTWLDFTDYYGDGWGNTLCLRTLPTDPPELINSTGNTSRNARTGFFVLDSSYGGGTPFADRLNANNVIAARPSSDPNGWDSPIWAEASSNYVRAAATYLDGVQVDGSTTGFSGRPEVLSFQFDRPVEIKGVGYYGGDWASKPNREILGEIIVYNTELEDETRERIEAYLMKKWLGRMPDGFVDFRDLEVAGTGVVEVPSVDALPRFAAGFSGTVSVTGGLSFAIDASGEVVNAVNVPGVTFALPSPCAVSVALDPTAPCGTYTLLTCAGFGEGQAFASVAVTGRDNVTARLIATGGVLSLDVIPQGTMILFR